MLQSIIFKGNENDWGWNGVVSMSPDAQFNRWAKTHPDIIIKGTSYSMTDGCSSICVMYEQPDDYIEKPIILEEGKYFISTFLARMIRCKDNVDVSYMVSDFTALTKLMFFDHENTCVATLKDGLFHTYRDCVYEKHLNKELPTTPYTVRDTHTLTIDAKYVIFNQYLPNKDVDSDILRSEKFSIKNYAGRYILNVNKKKLLRKDNNFDISFAVANWFMFSKNFPISDKEDTEIFCAGDTFIYHSDDQDYQFNCSEVIHENFI